MLVADGKPDAGAAGFPDEFPVVADAVFGGGVEVDLDCEGRILADDLGNAADGPVVIGSQAVVAGAEGVENFARHQVRKRIYIRGVGGVIGEH